MEELSYPTFGFMPVYIPISNLMLTPYAASQSYDDSESSLETGPDKVSEISDQDTQMKDMIFQLCESGNSWFPYQEGFWLRATSLKLLDDG